jgi:hypothetical protein
MLSSGGSNFSVIWVAILLVAIFLLYGFARKTGLGLSKSSWYLLIYAVLCALFVFYGTTSIYSTGSIRAVVFCIGASLVFLYYGLRWFGIPEETVKYWPPVINMCPDFLTFVPNIKSGETTVPGCVDLLGVSSSTNSAGGFLKVFPTSISTLDASMTTKVFSYTSNDVKSATTVAGLEAICDACKNAGLTWEGVYDGDSCLGVSRIETKKQAMEQCLVSI